MTCKSFNFLFHNSLCSSARNDLITVGILGKFKIQYLEATAGFHSHSRTEYRIIADIRPWPGRWSRARQISTISCVLISATESLDPRGKRLQTQTSSRSPPRWACRCPGRVCPGRPRSPGCPCAGCRSSSSRAPPGWCPAPSTPAPPRTAGRRHQWGSGASLQTRHYHCHHDHHHHDPPHHHHYQCYPNLHSDERCLCGRK